MELKVDFVVFDTTIAKGFNRTFMELKARALAHTHDALLFQSHLYGIERLFALM